MRITESTLRQVVLSPGEDGYFVAEVPSLPGCMSQGRTRTEAIANIREAIALFIEVLEAQGTPVPEDTLPSSTAARCGRSFGRRA